MYPLNYGPVRIAINSSKVLDTLIIEEIGTNTLNRVFRDLNGVWWRVWLGRCIIVVVGTAISSSMNSCGDSWPNSFHCS